MKTADEMFEELGYEKDINVSYGLIRYNKDDKQFIRFIIEEKCVEANTISENRIDILSLNMQELQAINKKVEELGWDDGKQR